MKIQFPDWNDEYRKAFLLGYRTGYQDAINKKEYKSESVPTDPIEVLPLSTRAYNCLYFAGLRYISEVASLPAENILRMRNLGKITANEVAVALQTFGIHGTDWDLFRL